MERLILIRPENERQERLSRVLAEAGLQEENGLPVIRRAEDFFPMRGERLLFAVSLDESGLNLEWMRMLAKLRRDPSFLTDCTGAVVVDGAGELYTKSAAQEAVYAANSAGCLFIGRPLVEGTGSLANLRVTAANLGTDLAEAYARSVRDLAGRLRSFSPPRHTQPKLLALHASLRETSNTLTLWGKVRDRLDPAVRVREISLQNGAVHDCIGCSFTTCLHFSSSSSCFYGGVVVEEVYPAFDEADAVIFLCPNYNDALSANLSASINRLTSLYRRRQFFDKYLYGIIVSGYSGGDLLARQLISSMNMNKTLILPPHFSLLETANDPGSILCAEGIDDRAGAFARQISARLLGR